MFDFFTALGVAYEPKYLHVPLDLIFDAVKTRVLLLSFRL